MGRDTLVPLRIGFVPLVDCAILVAAHEQGFAAREGLALTLAREAGWAAIRDKLSYGVLDAAHLLAGVPIARALGISGGGGNLLAPMALGLGGNAVTVSSGLYQRMFEVDPEAMRGPRAGTARALARVIAMERARGRPPLSFASVFPVSSHNFELRYWLASAGIDPDRDVNLGIIAPPRMAESLRAGWIDGYCVGEPWNLRAVELGIGAVVATKADIWPNSPEKVLGVRADWAERNPEVLAALIRALTEAARWADEKENRAELATLLAQDRYVGAPVAVLRQALEGPCVLRPGAPPESIPERHIFYRYQATFPWPSHAAWLISQMIRWGQVRAPVDVGALAQRVYRPDLYRAALKGTGHVLPKDAPRVAGGHGAPHAVSDGRGGQVMLGPDRFLDGRLFDPDDVAGYVAGFEIAHAAFNPSDLRRGGEN